MDWAGHSRNFWREPCQTTRNTYRRAKCSPFVIKPILIIGLDMSSGEVGAACHTLKCCRWHASAYATWLSKQLLFQQSWGGHCGLAADGAPYAAKPSSVGRACVLNGYRPPEPHPNYHRAPTKKHDKKSPDFAPAGLARAVAEGQWVYVPAR